MVTTEKNAAVLFFVNIFTILYILTRQNTEKIIEVKVSNFSGSMKYSNFIIKALKLTYKKCPVAFTDQLNPSSEHSRIGKESPHPAVLFRNSKYIRVIIVNKSDSVMLLLFFII